MRLMYVNNDGGGFADTIEAPEGQTVGGFFSQHMPDRSPKDFLIRINRMPATRDQLLKDGDRITVTPVKIEGAH